jgi:hypothetical protein
LLLILQLKLNHFKPFLKPLAEKLFGVAFVDRIISRNRFEHKVGSPSIAVFTFRKVPEKMTIAATALKP